MGRAVVRSPPSRLDERRTGRSQARFATPDDRAPLIVKLFLAYSSRPFPEAILSVMRRKTWHDPTGRTLYDVRRRTMGYFCSVFETQSCRPASSKRGRRDAVSRWTCRSCAMQIAVWQSQKGCLAGEATVLPRERYALLAKNRDGCIHTYFTM